MVTEVLILVKLMEVRLDLINFLLELVLEFILLNREGVSKALFVHLLEETLALQVLLINLIFLLYYAPPLNAVQTSLLFASNNDLTGARNRNTDLHSRPSCRL